MQEQEVIKILQDELNFTDLSIDKLKMFETELLNANKKHNFISKNTENVIWHRHVLDSAQLVKFIDFSKGSVAGFIFVINLFDLKGSDKLINLGHKVENLINFPGH